jgi:sterol desaturase/sphingolipid hydroxylase (fatty acid hydroxylase superfamily)
MSKYFKKNRSLFRNLLNCFKYNSNFYLIFFTMAFYIGAITGKFIRGAITIVLVLAFSYFSHRASHHIFPYNIFHKVHHTEEHNKKWWARLLEWVVNFLQIGGIMLIPLNMYLEKWSGMKLLNNYVILYYAIVYTTHHMINYHNMKIDSHVRHHQDEKTNYGPDYMDVLMGTKQDNTTFEDMRWSIMNSLAATMIVMAVYTRNIL